MKIVCPNCATSYEVALATIGENGRSVRCVRCRGIWFVDPDQEEEPVAAAMAAAPSEPAVPQARAEAPAPPAAGGDLDDLAAWGLADTPAPAEQAGGVASDPGAFSMDSLLEEMQAAAVPTTESPPLMPIDDWEGLGNLTHPPEDEAAASRRPRLGVAKFKPHFRAPSMPTVILVLLAIIAGILGWRGDVVRVMPQTASLFAALGLPVNLRGLAFEDVKAVKELQDGVPVLVLEGRIVNISRLMLEVPRIRFALRNEGGQEVYNWTTLPARTTLAPFTEQPFRTRLASPPADGREIIVRFFTRRDAVGGLR